MPGELPAGTSPRSHRPRRGQTCRTGDWGKHGSLPRESRKGGAVDILSGVSGVWLMALSWLSAIASGLLLELDDIKRPLGYLNRG